MNQVIKSSKGAYHTTVKCFSGLNNIGEIKNKDLMNYIDNLTSLGIMNYSESIFIAEEELYDNLKKDLAKTEALAKERYKDTDFNKIDYQKGKMELTSLGQGFLRAVFKSDK